jgi:cardiolipin synthase A/B
VERKRRPFPWALLIAALFSTWFAYKSLVLPLPQKGQAPKLYSNQCQQDIRALLLSAIRGAKSSIHLVMFGLSDKAVLTALKEKIAHHIPSRIYYDIGGSPAVLTILKGGDIHPFKKSGLMHQKILVLDHSLIFLGSANMTSSSLRMHDNLVVGFHSPPLAKFLETHEPFTPGYFQTRIGKQDVELWLLPDTRGHALTHVRHKIRDAKKTLRIALFTFTHPHLIDEVIEAHKRGVKVSVVIDQTSGLGASRKAIEQLAKARIPVALSQGVQLLHHKFVYIDDETLIMGSANWTKSAFYKNSDCLLTLHKLNSEQTTFMNSLWSRIENNSQKR